MTSEFMMEGEVVEQQLTVETGPIVYRSSRSSRSGDPETTSMFLTRVQGPTSQEEFGRYFTDLLLPRLSALGVTAGAWAEVGQDQRYVIQGWATSDPVQVMQLELGHLGWSALTRVFRALPGLPNHRHRIAVCQMPNNEHVVSDEDVVSCQQGHTFTDHKITHCVLDGLPLS